MNGFWNRKKIIVTAALMAAVVAAVAGTAASKKKAADIKLKEVKAVKGDIEVTILSTGVVQPENRLEIKPPIQGRVENVLVREGQRVKKGQVLAWMSSTERAALLDAARARGSEELKRWEEMYRPTPIMAPILGMIILRNVEPGQTFSAQDAVFIMSDRLAVKAQVDETDISQIKVGQKARVVLDAYSSKEIASQVGQIAYDAKTVNSVTTYAVDVIPRETPAFMRSGMTANVTFLVASKRDVLLVPADAVKVADGRSFVSGRGPQGGKTSELDVETGFTDGKHIEIIEGLTEGDVVMVPDIKIGSGGKKKAGSPLMPFGQGKKR